MESSAAAPMESGLAREVKFRGLLWMSVGSCIGSGWLFGGYEALSIAGPAALIAWAIATAVVAVVALSLAELSAAFPVSGGTSQYPHYAFGGFAGFSFGWFSYMQAATIAPIEVLAAIQYLSTTGWATGLYHADQGTLSATGLVVAVGMMLVFVTLNLLGIRWLAHANSWVTAWKVAVPVGASIVLMVANFHPGNLSAAGGFFVHGPGGGAESILAAIAGGGIIFSLMGFEQAVQLAGESANPGRDLPRAVLGALFIGFCVYVLAQLAFILALEPSLVGQLRSWQDLSKVHHLAQAPFFTLATLAGIGWLSWLLRADAVVSPSGTGLLYLTAASRLTFELARQGDLPGAFEVEEERTRVPIFGILATAALGLLFLLPFPSWNKLVNVVTGAGVLMYAGAPVSLAALRRSKPDLHRPYRLPAASVLAPLGFAFSTCIAYFAGWQTISTLMVVIALGYAALLGFRSTTKDGDRAPLGLRHSWWVLPYLAGVATLSYLGRYGEGGALGGIGPFKDLLVGGRGTLPQWWDLVAVAAFSLATFAVALRARQGAAGVDQAIAQVRPVAFRHARR